MACLVVSVKVVSAMVGQNAVANITIKNECGSSRSGFISGSILDSDDRRKHGTWAPQPWTDAQRPTTAQFSVLAGGRQTVQMVSAGKIHPMFDGKTLIASFSVDGQTVETRFTVGAFGRIGQYLAFAAAAVSGFMLTSLFMGGRKGREM